MSEPTDDLATLLDATIGAAHTVTPNADGTYSHSWSFPRQPVRLEGYDTIESEEELQQVLAAWDDPPQAFALADFEAVRLVGRGLLPYDHIIMAPAVYRLLRQAERRGWWRTLPRRDKRWVRRHITNKQQL